MPEHSHGALAIFGWSDRVNTLFNELAGPLDQLGRVVRVERSHSVVVCADGIDHRVASDARPAVGDWVTVSDGVIDLFLPRWSALTRRDPDGIGVQVLVANVDLVMITAPADRLSEARVERELAVAWDSGARPIVVFTKADVAAPSAARDLQARLAGVDVIATSAITGAGIDAVAEALRPDRTAVLLGPSGAGKSTLANALLGIEALATGAVREGDHRGRHTTTSRQLMVVPGGGVLIDTPGLRGIALAGDAVGQVFPEIEKLAVLCRFADCRHEVEPGCEVIAALSAGQLNAGRLTNFRKLQRELAVDHRSHEQLLRKAGRGNPRIRSANTNNKRK